MTIRSVLVSATVLAYSVLPAFAGEPDHSADLASAASYKPMAGFVYVVGPTRFVGYYLPSPDACRVTVLTAAADDEELVTPPRRMEIDIPAADRAELPAGDGSMLAIACAADANLVRIAPQRRPLSASRP